MTLRAKVPPWVSRWEMREPVAWLLSEVPPLPPYWLREAVSGAAWRRWCSRAMLSAASGASERLTVGNIIDLKEA